MTRGQERPRWAASMPIRRARSRQSLAGLADIRPLRLRAVCLDRPPARLARQHGCIRSSLASPRACLAISDRSGRRRAAAAWISGSARAPALPHWLRSHAFASASFGVPCARDRSALLASYGPFGPGWHRRRSSLTPEARAGAAPVGRIDADPSRAVPAVPCWPSGHPSASASRGLPRPITGAHCSPAWLHSQLAGIYARLPCDLRQVEPPSCGGSVDQQQRAGTGTPSLASLTYVRLSFVRCAVRPGPVGVARQLWTIRSGLASPPIL